MMNSTVLNAPVGINRRNEANTIVDRFRGGKLAPIMAVPVKGGESGMVSQTVTLELDPIVGRMITPISAEVYAVFVPTQAIDALKDPAAAYAGITEVIREKLLSGNPLFALETENEISMRMGIEPASYNGVKKVNEATQIAHNVAVNHLRKKKYWGATELVHSSRVVTPAILGATILDRLNGVLDPDDHVNGAVNLELPSLQLPVSGIGYTGVTGSFPSTNVKETPNVTTQYPTAVRTYVTGDLYVETNGANGFPAVFAQLNGQTAGSVSLQDFYNAEKMDARTRQMRKIVDENPEYGEEMILRWAHGLTVDTGKTPFVLAERKAIFGRSLVPAMDSAGVTGDVMRSDMMLQMSWEVPVPRTELGGVIVTLACVKPDEVLARQPHPILSDVWGAENFIADELALDPVPVTLRQLDNSITSAQESTVSFYTGLNALKQSYVHYGLSRRLDPTTVENKTAIWQVQIPTGVTADNILYPETLPHTPFANQNAEVVTSTTASFAVFQTPTVFGPTPVEQLAILTSADLFDEVQ